MLLVTLDFGLFVISWQKMFDSDVQGLNGVSPLIDGFLQHSHRQIQIRHFRLIKKILPGTSKIRYNRNHLHYRIECSRIFER